MASKHIADPSSSLNTTKSQLARPRSKSSVRTVHSPEPWPLLPSATSNDNLKYAIQKELSESDDEFKTARSEPFSQLNNTALHSSIIATLPTHASPLKDTLFEDLDSPSSKDTFIGTESNTSSSNELTVAFERKGARKYRVSDTPSSGSVIDFLRLNPEEEQVIALSQQDRSGSKYCIQNEILEIEEQNIKSPAPVKSLFADEQEKDRSEASTNYQAKSFNPDVELFSPRKISGDSEEGNKVLKTVNMKSSRLFEPKALKSTREHVNRPPLRRPLGSRRNTLIELLQPQPRKSPTPLEIENTPNPVEKPNEKQKHESISTENPITPESGSSIHVISPLGGRGVIVRPQTHKANVDGIRKAETGKIMSREEMLRDQNLSIFKDSPVPKSLNPAAFYEDDDTASRKPSSIFCESSSDVEKPTGISRTPSLERCDGSFLQDNIFVEKQQHSASLIDVQSYSSSKFSETDGSSGFVGRLGSSFKKAANAVGKRSFQGISNPGNTDLIVSGTIDEAVCKICFVCRKKLDCEVTVKQGGKKIRIQSDDQISGYHLRASLLLKQINTDEATCAVHVRQSRGDGTRTSFATLWDFYQRLDSKLQELS